MNVHPVIDAVRQARKARGWRQADLAALSGVSAATVAGWESGAVSPQLGRLATVLDLLSLRLEVVPLYADPARPAVRVDPAQRVGYPNVGGIPIDAIGWMVVHEGVDKAAEEYGLRRADVLVACWHLGRYGPPHRFRSKWGKWARAAGDDMWHGEVARYAEIPDPPDWPKLPATTLTKE